MQRDSAFNLAEGRILHKLLVVAVPVMGSQIMQMAYNLTDMFWLGRLDNSNGVAASGVVGMYLWLSMAFMVLGARGAEIGISQNIGKGDMGAARTIGQSSFTLSFILGALVMAVYMLFNAPLVGFFGIIDSDVEAMARSYLILVSIGIPFTFITAAMAGAFNGSGNAQTPFFINFIALTLNMILDPLLIIKFDMGVEGAAIATVIAQITAAVLLACSLKWGRRRPFEQFKLFILPKMEHVRMIFRWTAPMAIESFFFTFLSMFISQMVAVYGTSAMAAQRVASQVESLSWLIAGGFASALTAFVGQNFGARKWTRIHRGVSLSTVTMALWGGVITAVMVFLGAPICRLFLSADPEAVEIGATYLRILALCQLVACLEAVASGSFRGLGITTPPSVVSVVCNAVRVVLAYVLMRTPLGINGIWVAVTIGAGVRGIWMYIWYKKVAREKPRSDEVTGDAIIST